MPVPLWKALHLPAWLTAGIAAGLGALAYAYWIEPRWIDVHHVTLNLPRLSLAFDRYRVVQISDLHMNGFMTAGRLCAVVRRINALQPDLVALTGDFVTSDAYGWAEPLAAGLSGLTPRDGTVAVLGNHDHWSGANVIRQMLCDSGITDLSNAVCTLRRGSDFLHVSGIDDYAEREDRLDLVLDSLPSDGAAVLLAHEPDFADLSAAVGRFDLQISGHTHGGQVRVPFVGPLVLPRDGRKYPAGLYRVGEMLLYTNRGIGLISPRVRFNCRPEITVYTLRAS